MPPEVVFLIWAIGGSMAFLVARRRRRAQMTEWHVAAAAAGLQGVRTESDLFDQRLEGRTGGLQVRFRSYRHGRSESGTRIEIDCTPGRASALTIKPEGLGTALGKELGSHEIEIGDPTFDRECFIQGTASRVLAILDRSTRRTLAGLLGGYLPMDGAEVEVRAALENGVLSVELRDYVFGRAGARVTAALPVILGLARRLVPPPDLAARLAENLGSEPKSGVRLQIVLALAREFGDAPPTRPALAAACHDSSAEVRLRAATALGEEGHDTLLALLSQEDADDSCRARAVEALGAALEPSRLAAVLQQARAAGRPLTACACLDLLAGRSPREHIETLLIDSLADLQLPVRIAAARGLGRVGTAAAVAPLLEAEAAGGELRGAARQAIAEIQARLTGAAPGQLSLAAAEAGTLSFADGEPGRLSLGEGAAETDLEPAAPRTMREPLRSKE